MPATEIRRSRASAGQPNPVLLWTLEAVEDRVWRRKATVLGRKRGLDAVQDPETARRMLAESIAQCPGTIRIVAYHRQGRRIYSVTNGAIAEVVDA